MVCVFLQAWIVQTGAGLIRLCRLQEVGCVFGGLSQEVADCIMGGQMEGGVEWMD